MAISFHLLKTLDTVSDHFHAPVALPTKKELPVYKPYCMFWKRMQDRQCTYKVTLRRVRITIVAAEKQ